MLLLNSDEANQGTILEHLLRNNLGTFTKAVRSCHKELAVWMVHTTISVANIPNKRGNHSTVEQEKYLMTHQHTQEQWNACSSCSLCTSWRDDWSRQVPLRKNINDPHVSSTSRQNLGRSDNSPPTKRTTTSAGNFLSSDIVFERFHATNPPPPPPTRKTRRQRSAPSRDHARPTSSCSQQLQPDARSVDRASEANKRSLVVTAHTPRDSTY